MNTDRLASSAPQRRETPFGLIAGHRWRSSDGRGRERLPVHPCHWRARQRRDDRAAGPRIRAAAGAAGAQHSTNDEGRDAGHQYQVARPQRDDHLSMTRGSARSATSISAGSMRMPRILPGRPGRVQQLAVGQPPCEVAGMPEPCCPARQRRQHSPASGAGSTSDLPAPRSGFYALSSCTARARHSMTDAVAQHPRAFGELQRQRLSLFSP